MPVEKIAVSYPEAVVSTDLLRPRATRPRFEFLDGIRGFAALYVVVFHLYYDAINNINERTLPWGGHAALLAGPQDHRGDRPGPMSLN